MKARMLKAAGWVLGGNLGGQLIRLGSNLVLTRLLLPESFGLVALRYQVIEQLMFARGQLAWVMANNALRALALLLVPQGMAHGGIEGAVLAVALAQFASWPLALLYKWRTGLFTAASEAWWLPALVVGAALGWIADRALTAIAGWLT
jgi:O-antigen/teichoic acid export membrane protein